MQEKIGVNEFPKIKYVTRDIDSFTYRITYSLSDLIYILILMTHLQYNSWSMQSDSMFDQMEFSPPSLLETLFYSACFMVG